MLGALKTMWVVLNLVRNELRERNITMEIRFVLAYPALEKTEIAKTIQDWAGLGDTSVRKDVLQELKLGDETLENLRLGRELTEAPHRPFTRYFHCELQLLHLLHGEERSGRTPHEYIGVSKLSCYLCHSMLARPGGLKTPYRTKDGHYQISANCAFPFDITRGYGYILEALVAAQASMLQCILRKVVHIDAEYSINTEMEHTQLGSISASLVSRYARASAPLLRVVAAQGGDFITVQALRLAASSEESQEAVRLMDATTAEPLSSDRIFPRHLVPECLLRGGWSGWKATGLKFSSGGRPLRFIIYYREKGNAPPNRGAFAETTRARRYSSEEMRGKEIDEYFFRGDIWIFRVDLATPVYQHIYPSDHARRNTRPR